MIVSAVGRYARRQVRGRAARTIWRHLIGAHPQPILGAPAQPIAHTLPGSTLRCRLLAWWQQVYTAHTAPRLVLHALLVTLTLLVLIGEQAQGWSQYAYSPRDSQRIARQRLAASRQARPLGEMPAQLVPFRVVLPVVRAPLPEPMMEQLVPVLREPTVDMTPVFSKVHYLGRDESLGDLAREYGISLEALVWSNNLQNGDVLMADQPLRIPRIAGVPHRIVPGETLDTIAARYGVAAESIAAFGPNQLVLNAPLSTGQELFIPGAVAPLPELLLSVRGGYAGVAASKAQPVGIVQDARTNMRAGPDSEYDTIAQFGAGRRAALLARHAEWLKVDIGGQVGWMRADLLAVAPDTVAALPATNDFPPPPPPPQIWVWPAHGAFTSGFGPRWGGFHNGIDIANGAGTPIMAARAGRVIEAGWCSGYGYCVKMSHEGGIGTVYGHLLSHPVVSAGELVKAGEVIGYMGSTYDARGGGYSTGVHLHFTVTVNGRAVNPLNFLP